MGAPDVTDAPAVAAGSVGDAAWAAEDDAAVGVAVSTALAAAAIVALDVAVAVAVADGLALARVTAVRWPPPPPVDAANTAAPSARSPMTARIGTGGRGESVRQFGQKPETGVNR